MAACWPIVDRVGAIAVTLVAGSLISDDFLFRVTFGGKSAAFVLMVRTLLS